jgi:cytoskeletal protein CcmA (bactofilin family)
MLASARPTCQADAVHRRRKALLMRRRVLIVVALAATALVLVAAPAAAKPGDRLRDQDRRINVTGGLVVKAGETVTGVVVSVDGDVTVDGVVQNDVYVGRGDLRVTGTVTGDVLVGRGDAIIDGKVGGDIVVVDGRAIVRDGATVAGDVTSRKEPRVAPDTVKGDVKKLNVGNILSGFLIVFLVLLWITVTISVAILGSLFLALFPRAADASAAAGKRFWLSVAWGLLVGVVGPVIAVGALTTLVGIPLGGGILSALTVLGPLGYVVSSLCLGRLMVKGTSGGARFGAFFAGFGILRAAALIPGLGFLVWFGASIYGIGALTVAAWRAGHGGAPPTERAAVPAEPAAPAPDLEPAAVPAAPTPTPEAESAPKPAKRATKKPAADTDD